MAAEPSPVQILANTVSDAVGGRAEMTVAAQLAIAAFNKSTFDRSADLRRELVTLYRFFRREVDDRVPPTE